MRKCVTSMKKVRKLAKKTFFNRSIAHILIKKYLLLLQKGHSKIEPRSHCNRLINPDARYSCTNMHNAVNVKVAVEYFY
jgi:hypothetical protein